MREFDVIEDGLTFHFEEAEEGGYVASVPDLPGCHTEGETLDETLANIREALVLYVEASIAEGLPLPDRYRKLRVRAS